MSSAAAAPSHAPRWPTMRTGPPVDQDGRPRWRRSPDLQEPNGNQNDQIINSYALPVLNNEVVQLQSAKIDLVSGATVTSSGYAKSLQSAIDQAFGS